MMRTLRWQATFGLCIAAVSPLAALSQDLGAYVDTLRGSQPFVLQSFVLQGSESLFVQGQTLDSTAYELDYRYGRLWVPLLGEADTLIAHYRTWGVQLRDEYTRPFAPVTEAGGDSLGVPRNVLSGESEAPRASRSLSRTGSISRGVLVGNNRDAVIESGLRLQVAGEVAKDVHVKAMLTDESTPILPEGTTQRLSELDRVYIEITAPPGLAQLGDFAIDYSTSEFAQLRRKVQGVGVTAPSPLATVQGNAQAIGAASRGIFRREKISITEGVQGPYRLSGEQGEPFIFVVPGSEVVYLNGRQMQRGQSLDYIIDYATGEVTFTTNRSIRYHDRVVVEYQYRTTEFTRTLAGGTADVSFGTRPDGPARGTLGVTVLREADGEALSEAFGFTADDEALLRAAGDSVAQRTGAVPVVYDPEAPYVQYVQRDTLLGGQMYTVFESISQAPTETVYRVNFNRVGAGQGSYRRQGHATNGLVYTWVGPGRGSYEPVRILPRPREQRMIDLRGAVSPWQFVEFYGEWAQSLYDANRLSSLHKGDDLGHAFTGGVRVSPFSVGLGTVELSARRRNIGASFAAFGRVRPIEFERQWLLNSAQTADTRSDRTVAHEIVDEAEFLWEATERSSLSAALGRIELGDQFSAERQEGELELEEDRLPYANYDFIRIKSTDHSRSELGSWVRQTGQLSHTIGAYLTPELRIKQNKRTLTVMGTDSLTAKSSSYMQYTPGVFWRAPKAEFGVSMDVRIEDRGRRGVFARASHATTWDFQFNVNPSSMLRTEGRIGLRRRITTESGIDRRNSTAVVRWSGRIQPWQRLVQLNWFYEALSERSPVLQEIYIRTGPELGEYVWVDANGNGVAELDEFLPESTQDEGNYVYSLFPSDSLQGVVSLQSRFTLRFEPPRSWETDDSRIKQLLRHVSSRTMIRVQEKSRNPAISDVYLLRLGTFRSPEHTLRGQLVVQQDLFLLRDYARFGLDLTYRKLRTLSELTAGAESRATDEYRAEARSRLSSQWVVSASAARGRRRTTSEAFASRNFDIRSQTFAPSVTFVASSQAQLSLESRLTTKTAEDLRATLWRMPLTARYSHARRFNVAARLEPSSVRIRGNKRLDGLALFELSDGLGAGDSWIWSLTSWYQISSVLRATLSYTGRRPQDAPTIHSVRMQLSATL